MARDTITEPTTVTTYCPSWCTTDHSDLSETAFHRRDWLDGKVILMLGAFPGQGAGGDAEIAVEVDAMTADEALEVAMAVGNAAARARGDDLPLRTVEVTIPMPTVADLLDALASGRGKLDRIKPTGNGWIPILAMAERRGVEWGFRILAHDEDDPRTDEEILRTFIEAGLPWETEVLALGRWMASLPGQPTRV